MIRDTDLMGQPVFLIRDHYGYASIIYSEYIFHLYFLAMENLLGVVYERRQLVLEKLRKCRKLDPCSAHYHESTLMNGYGSSIAAQLAAGLHIKCAQCITKMRRLGASVPSSRR